MLDGWFRELVEVVPADLVEPFGVLDGFVDELALGIDGGRDLDERMAAAIERIDGGEAALDAAAERTGDATDAGCHGRTDG